MKGFTALEIVFMIFILIVVAIIVIQLVVKNVSTQKLSEVVQSVQELRKYTYMRDKCSKICDNIKSASSYKERLTLMATWCSYKIVEGDREGIDINEDGFFNGFYVVNGFPYCEDGTYCFLFFSCDLGSMYLDMDTCRKILCQYYAEIRASREGIDLADLLADPKSKEAKIVFGNATQDVEEVIDPGSCKVTTKLLPKGAKLVEKSATWWYDSFEQDLDCGEILVEDGKKK